jgi:hypothetical protein
MTAMYRVSSQQEKYIFQTLSPPPSQLSIPLPPALYIPPNPATLADLLLALLLFFQHVLLRPFSATLRPASDLHPNAVGRKSPTAIKTATAAPTRKGRGRSKSPGGSPVSSTTLLSSFSEAETAAVDERLSVGPGPFEVPGRERIRRGRKGDAVKSRHEEWARNVFRLE